MQAQSIAEIARTTTKAFTNVTISFRGLVGSSLRIARREVKLSPWQLEGWTQKGRTAHPTTSDRPRMSSDYPALESIFVFPCFLSWEVRWPIASMVVSLITSFRMSCLLMHFFSLEESPVSPLVQPLCCRTNSSTNIFHTLFSSARLREAVVLNLRRLAAAHQQTRCITFRRAPCPFLCPLCRLTPSDLINKVSDWSVCVLCWVGTVIHEQHKVFEEKDGVWTL